MRRIIATAAVAVALVALSGCGGGGGGTIWNTYVPSEQDATTQKQAALTFVTAGGMPVFVAFDDFYGLEAAMEELLNLAQGQQGKQCESVEMDLDDAQTGYHWAGTLQRCTSETSTTLSGVVTGEGPAGTCHLRIDVQIVPGEGQTYEIHMDGKIWGQLPAWVLVWNDDQTVSWQQGRWTISSATFESHQMWDGDQQTHEDLQIKLRARMEANKAWAPAGEIDGTYTYYWDENQGIRQWSWQGRLGLYVAGDLFWAQGQASGSYDDVNTVQISGSCCNGMQLSFNSQSSDGSYDCSGQITQNGDVICTFQCDDSGNILMCWPDTGSCQALDDVLPGIEA